MKKGKKFDVFDGIIASLAGDVWETCTIATEYLIT
jgi:hypothetical protein